MIVGTLKLRLYLRDCHSLKDKRRVLRSLKDTLHNKFNVAAAETGELDVWQTAELGVAAVGNEGQHVQSVISGVLNFTRCFGGVEVVAEEQDIFGD